MILEIREIDRRNNTIAWRWIDHYSSIKECLEHIESLDKNFGKRFFKFKYIIYEENK